jgi:hypothetical protein
MLLRLDHTSTANIVCVVLLSLSILVLNKCSCMLTLIIEMSMNIIALSAPSSYFLEKKSSQTYLRYFILFCFTAKRCLEKDEGSQDNGSGWDIY